MSKNIKNLDKFISEVQNFSNYAVPVAVLEFQKLLVKELHRAILTKTPIKDGILRGNWVLAINEPDQSFDESRRTEAVVTGADLTAEESAQVEAILADLHRMGLGNTVHLSNSTPYAQQAEIDGWTYTPPYAMVALSLQEVETAIAAAKKEFEMTVTALQKDVQINYVANLR